MTLLKADRMAGRYGAALVLLILGLVYTMAMQEGQWQILGAMALQGIALFATLRASRADRRLLWAISVLFLGAFLWAFTYTLTTAESGAAFVRMSVLLVVLATLPAIAYGLVRQVRAAGRITVQTMMGTLCAYLLMMSAFAYAYAVIGELGDGPFFNQGEQWNQVSDYLYYSLITITTVGMGDLTPATQLGRSLTGAEALIGQIYMVTVVAVIVSNLGRPRPAHNPADASPGESEKPGPADDISATDPAVSKSEGAGDG
jgi:hypothetical protein